MRKWSVFVVLAVMVLGLLAAKDLLQEGGQGGAGQTVRLSTHTPTATRTLGWWVEVATWTPTPTGGVAPESTEETAATPTPELKLPPVKTVVPPTRDGGKP